MAWLVTGGAGYIGAHVVKAFTEAGISTVVVDDLSSGRRDHVTADIPFVHGSITNDEVLNGIFTTHAIDGVIHLAGYKYAGESVLHPLVTYENNVVGTARLLAAMAKSNVKKIVFSSSSSVYGTPDVDIVTESTMTNPQSPYGETKLIGEWLIHNQAIVEGLTHTSLRYANVVGSGTVDIMDTSPHNFFPRVFDALIEGRVPKVFGNDYPTQDGTCVRDYVHVSDVAAAHVRTAQSMMAGTTLEKVYNLGSGVGMSVGQILTTMSESTGIDFQPEVHGRRPGDPARIVLDGSLATRDLGWPESHSIEDMVSSAWLARQAQS
jgi:UDP-glucose 4-epimerase